MNEESPEMINMSLDWNNALVIGKSFGIILAFACVSDFMNNSMQFCFWFEHLGYGSGPLSCVHAEH